MADSPLAAIVLPVFCFIGLGYLIVATRILTDDVGDALANFVFTIAVPLLLFRAVGTLDVPPIDPWPFWLAYFGGVAVNIVLGVVIIQKVFGRDGRVAVAAAMSAGFSNVVMMGMPMITTAFGEPGLLTILVLIAVHLPIMMTISAVMVEIAEVRHAGREVRLARAMGRVVVNVLKSPLIIAILSGIAFRFTGFSLTGVPAIVIDGISDTAIPLALIALGMSLHKYGIRGNVLPAIVIGSVKLAVLPAVVFALATLLDLSPLAKGVAVVAAACPTGANAYLIAHRFQTGLALSANTITLTTAASLLTLGFWISLFE